RGSQIAEKIGTARYSFLGQEIDEEKRCGRHTCAACAERVGHRHVDAGRFELTNGEMRSGRAHFAYRRSPTAPDPVIAIRKSTPFETPEKLDLNGDAVQVPADAPCASTRPPRSISWMIGPPARRAPSTPRNRRETPRAGKASA